jgi:hypothetical protein
VRVNIILFLISTPSFVERFPCNNIQNNNLKHFLCYRVAKLDEQGPETGDMYVYHEGKWRMRKINGYVVITHMNTNTLGDRIDGCSLYFTPPLFLYFPHVQTYNDDISVHFSSSIIFNGPTSVLCWWRCKTRWGAQQSPPKLLCCCSDFIIFYTEVSRQWNVHKSLYYILS